MLRPVQRISRQRPISPSQVLIIASRYNANFVDGMLRGARKVLGQAPGVKVDLIRVPGAFEIPAVAAKAAAAKGRFSAVICLGVILRGETTHAQFIGESISLALAQLQIQTQLPVIHEVLLLENQEQARVRCLGSEHNRGAEAASTALEMIETMRRLEGLIKRPRGGEVNSP